jgi:HEAT repeat protein
MNASTDLTLPAPLALAVVLAVIALAVYLSRAHARRQSRQARNLGRDLVRAFERHLSDRSSPGELRRAVAAAGESAFWSALETYAHTLTRTEWLRLSRALERNPYAPRERRALGDDSPWRRVLAARRLGLLRSRASRTTLRRALARGPGLVAHAAAGALARYHDRAALRWILDHPGALARRPHVSLVALLRAFGPRTPEALAAALDHGLESPVMERAVIEALGLARYSPARAAIERRVASSDLDLRVAAVRALGRLQAVETATSLLAALKDDAWQVRAQAARALGRIRAPIAVEALTRRLTDSSWWVRRHSAYALMELGSEGRDALREVIQSSPDPYARDMAREALDGGPHLDAA